MKTNLFPFVLIPFLFLISCERDNFIDEPFDGVLLKEVRAEDIVYYQYTYTNAGFISEEKSKFYYTNHNYNSHNQLVQSNHYFDMRLTSSTSYVVDEALKRTEWVSPENTQKDSYFSFEYNELGRLEKRISNRLNTDYKWFDIFSFNGAGEIVKRTSYHENKVSVYDEYFYDSSGNMKKAERYLILENGTPELQTTTEYEFDNKHNPYLSFSKLMIPGQNTNPNNIVKETYTLHFEVDKFIDKVQIKEYGYEYNLMGYPVKRSDGFEYVYY
jgi:hypothetical protein